MKRYIKSSIDQGSFILTKDTKNLVEVGDIFRFQGGKSCDVVTNMFVGANGRSMYVSLRNIKDYNPTNRVSMLGRTLYGEPISHLYGAEVVKPEYFTDEDRELLSALKR